MTDSDDANAQPRSRLGRQPAAERQLPDVRDEAEAIAIYLKERDEPQRRPEVTARILALAVRLHLDGRQPWPTRKQIARHLDVSLPMIDVVMSSKQATRDISLWTSTIKGNIRGRDSVITQRFVRPSHKLIEVVQRAAGEQEPLPAAPKRPHKPAARQKAESIAAMLMVSAAGTISLVNCAHCLLGCCPGFIGI